MLQSPCNSVVEEMHQATTKVVKKSFYGFAWLDACNRKPKAELLQVEKFVFRFLLTGLEYDVIL